LVIQALFDLVEIYLAFRYSFSNIICKVSELLLIKKHFEKLV
jgi:hypothetical protein